MIAADSAGRSTAFGLDTEWGSVNSDGLHIIADASFGTEGRAGVFTSTLAGLRATAPRADFSPRFRTIYLVGEYRVPLTSAGALTGIGPVFRFDRTTPDTGNDVSSTFITPGLNLYFGRNAWVLFNYDVVMPGGLDLGRGASEAVYSFKSMLRIFF